MPLTISVFERATDAQPQIENIEFSDLLEDFENPAIVEEPASLTRAESLKKEVAAWSPAVFSGRRSKDTVTELSLLVYDLDGENKDGVELEPLLAQLRATNLTWALHSTTRSGFCSDGRVKLRLVFPLSRPVNTDEYDRLWVDTKNQLGIEPDGTRRGPEGMYFVPVIFAEHRGRYVFEKQLGELLAPDVDRVSTRTFSKSIKDASIGRGRTEAQWLEFVRNERDKSNALTKAVPGVVGRRLREKTPFTDSEIVELFCGALRENRHVPVVDWDKAQEQIQKHISWTRETHELEEEATELANSIKPVEKADPKLVTMARKRLERDTKQLVSGKSDLEQVATEMGRYVPRILSEEEVTRALVGAGLLLKKPVRTETEVRSIVASGLAVGSANPIGWGEEWQRELEIRYVRGKDGMEPSGFTTSDHNLSIVFSDHPDLAGVLGFCVRRNAVVYRKPAPWGGAVDERVVDGDSLPILRWVSETLGNKGAARRSVFQTMLVAAGRDRFDPFLEWVDTLPKATGWGNLERVLIDCCGAEDTPYVRLVTRLWFTSVYARQVKPGSYCEGALVLCGRTGAGKSAFFKQIFPKGLRELCTTSHMPRWDDKDVHFHLSKMAVVELAELAHVKGKDLENVKAFMTQESADVRRAYAETEQLYPRRTVFGGTTEEDRFLTDKQGNRRFWPVKIKKTDFARLEALASVIWSEARFAYESGAGWVVQTDAEREMLATVHAEHMEEDLRMEMLKGVLEEPVTGKGGNWKLPGAGDSTGSVVAEEGQCKIGELVEWVTLGQLTLWLYDGKKDNYVTSNTSKMLRALGWENKVKRINGKLKKVWVRVSVG